MNFQCHNKLKWEHKYSLKLRFQHEHETTNYRYHRLKHYLSEYIQLLVLSIAQQERTQLQLFHIHKERNACRTKLNHMFRPENQRENCFYTFKIHLKMIAVTNYLLLVEQLASVELEENKNTPSIKFSLLLVYFKGQIVLTREETSQSTVCFSPLCNYSEMMRKIIGSHYSLLWKKRLSFPIK